MQPTALKHRARVFYPYAGVPRELSAFAAAVYSARAGLLDFAVPPSRFPATTIHTRSRSRSGRRRCCGCCAAAVAADTGAGAVAPTAEKSAAAAAAEEHVALLSPRSAGEHVDVWGLSPVEGIRDVALIEAILRSGDKGGVVCVDGFFFVLFIGC